MLHLNEPAHFDAFVRLNTAWITRYFELEPPDHVLFARPVAIIEQGGCLLSLTLPTDQPAETPIVTAETRGTIHKSETAKRTMPGESVAAGNTVEIPAEQVVGVCAVLKKQADVFELSKMAVDENHQGQGLGNVLMQAALDWAQQQGGQKMTLITNSKLQAAIAMYRKHGFVITWEGPHPEYSRGDVLMEKPLC